MKLNVQITKSAVLLANEHQSDQKNVTNDFRLIFAMNSFTQKPAVNGMPENVASGRILTKLVASVFHRL